MLNLQYFIAKNLLLLHEGITMITQIRASVKIAFGLSIPTWLLATLSDWTITNQEFIAGVLVCIAVDHIVGSYYHAFKVRDFSLKKNLVGLLNKLALCAAAAVLFEVIHYTIKDLSLIYDYLKNTTRLIIILYPAGSAFLNMSALTNGAFPPLGWIKKITAYNNTLDLDKIYRNGSGNVTEDKTASSDDKTGSTSGL